MSEHSPAGTSHREARQRRRTNPEYSRIEASISAYEQLARIIIRHRMALGLTQEQLALKVGTSNTAISRLESGRHPTKPETLSRIAAAMEMRFVMGFESGPEDDPVRELVSA
jgi:ribosome-binding protein aMBF1 (putative translation factor)